MQLTDLTQYTGSCFNGEPASCACACPFALDVRGFAEKGEKGRWNAAWKALKTAVVFPSVVAALCPAPCREHCQRASLGGAVDMIGGLSLGGQVLAEMLSQRSGLCRCALVESAMVIPSKVTHALIAPAFGSSYGLIRKERFARLQFRSLHMKEDLFQDYYRDTYRIEKADLIAFMRASTAYALRDSIVGCGAKVRVFIGEKETGGIRQSARMLGGKIPGCEVTVLPGLYHGEFSLNHPADYAQAVRNLLHA